MEKIKALANYLGVEETELETSSYDDNIFEVNGESYLVLDDYETWDYVKDYVEGCIDDLGLKDSFTPNFFDWIINNAVYDYVIEDIIRNSNENLIYDLKDDEGGEFKNRFIEDLYEHNYLTDDDFELDEDGEVDFTILKDSVDLDSLESDYLEYLVDNDSIDNIMTEDELASYVEENSAYNLDKIVDELIAWDGVAHFLATYDGDEIELEDNLLAYRID